jgi:hypothetical protein
MVEQADRVSKEVPMKTRHIAVVALVAAITLTSVAATGASAQAQRVAITSNGEATMTPASGNFEFTPMQAGALKADLGTDTSGFRIRSVTRRGYRVEIETGVTKSKGRHGSFELTYRVEWVSAGNGYKVGTGTWRFLRGTGQYANVVGGGRAASAYHAGRWSTRSEGLLTVR